MSGEAPREVLDHAGGIPLGMSMLTAAWIGVLSNELGAVMAAWFIGVVGLIASMYFRAWLKRRWTR